MNLVDTNPLVSKLPAPDLRGADLRGAEIDPADRSEIKRLRGLVK